jgi:ribosomal protein L31
MDLRLGVAVVPATQATHLSNLSKVTSISVRANRRSTKGNFLSSSTSSTVRTTSREEINISVRATRHPAFLPKQPTRTTKQLQCKEEVVHVSTVGNKAIGRIIAQRK